MALHSRHCSEFDFSTRIRDQCAKAEEAIHRRVNFRCNIKMAIAETWSLTDAQLWILSTGVLAWMLPSGMSAPSMIWRQIKSRIGLG
ncbi:hypothetical protein OC844_002882 [Tilletia horrida]|nr:hypothetical protein OC844_002882 [Tilletia horrida]